uniref:EF-hand domain-containing protein n=1 Tax=Polytomella parva TaxID=51329 RepID=A0A7S0URI0_9CHLO|mmetsp:Transcript_18377/g.33474  ORF Transcript_18377/g.33474 Transcript_18377/m.33474 type:complete len:236 (+) Transcript_18377:87-794(+)|eukprot:CAMPEP_0175045512 /NCGR_PEP_ID=MMETSP0052_2-20121109/4468_1 /TAXON_ID=51329 ORGANISM="Polytomella parva, Strain SAG 63-3" /NCGR_SAMPLE_ID=MMETSP0052_2 /ASSEMBLY_ACC=CAM_ASM_000194 /LENGTH=235 /DNA_ID=CAMNT_0016309059 /DNA_START=58 /DNA_END=765 /DNA_ORIENTATION=+
MGCNSSKGVEASNPTAVALERKLVLAVERARGKGTPKGSFSTLLLTFPKLRGGFTKVRALFKELDINGDGGIEWHEFLERCPRIGLDPSTPSLKEMFALADMENKQAIGSDEMILVFTIIYLLEPDFKDKIKYPEIIVALQILEKAFIFLDPSNTGYINRDEMSLAVKSGTRVTHGKQSKSIADKLFDTLDWDGSGRITFKEFMVGIEKLVMEDSDEDNAYDELGEVDEADEMKG